MWLHSALLRSIFLAYHMSKEYVQIDIASYFFIFFSYATIIFPLFLDQGLAARRVGEAPACRFCR